MAKKDFKLLVACNNKKFLKNLVRKLIPIYTVKGAKDIRELAVKLKTPQSLVVIDHQFMGFDAVELQKKISPYCQNLVFVVYSEAERKAVTEKTKKYRAIDYILYTPRVMDFAEKIHKAVRWNILQSEVSYLGLKISTVAESIKKLSKKIENFY